MSKSIVKKAAELDKVVQISSAHGANYTPSNEVLQPTALALLLVLVQDKVKAVTVAHNAYRLAVNARAESFEGVPKLATKIARMIAASNASASDKAEAGMMRRWFSPSKRTTSKKVAAQQDGSAPKIQRSISKLDRESIMHSFGELINLAESIPSYKPVEPEFQIAALKARLDQMRALTKATSESRINLSNARIESQELMSGPKGVHETIRLAKDYIRAKFGMLSPQARQTIIQTKTA